MAVNDSDVVQSPVAHAAQGSQDPVSEDHVLVEVDVPGVAVSSDGLVRFPRRWKDRATPVAS